MRKFIKFVAITFVAAFVVVLLGSTIAIGERTYSYMSRQKFDFATALSWAKSDFDEWINSVWGKNDEDNVILSFDMCNKHIEVVACTDH